MPTVFTTASAGAITRDSAASSNALPATMSDLANTPHWFEEFGTVRLLRHRTIHLLPSAAPVFQSLRGLQTQTHQSPLRYLSSCFPRFTFARFTPARQLGAAPLPQRQVRSAVSAIPSIFLPAFCLKWQRPTQLISPAPSHQFPAKSPAVLI